jgi:uncharacterized protein YbjT (DUF2867 family)
MKVLTVGAVGHLGGLVVPALVRRGALVRGLVRKREQISAAKDRGSSEVAMGDLADPKSLDAALDGVDAVFHIGPVFAPNEVQIGRNMVEAALRARVRKFVFSSVIHPILLGLPNHAAKAPVEEALVNSGLEFTILHPTTVFQNYAASWGQIVETGILAEPWSADTRISRVDYRDVAEVAAIALTEDRLVYGTFELCAPEIHTRHDVAALAGEILHREIKVGTLDPTAMGDIPQDMKTMFAHLNRHGLLGNPLQLRTILSREPRNLRAYFLELAAARG